MPIDEPKNKSASAPANETVLSEEDAWKNAVDLLKLVKPERDGVCSRWSLNNGVLVFQQPVLAPQEYPRITLPYLPPAEYDAKITFVRPQSNECLILYLVRGGRQFGWMLSSWKGTVLGFDTYQGKRAKDFPQNTRSEAAVENGRRYTVLAQIRTSSVRVYLDGKLLSESQAPASDFGVVPHWALPNADCLGMGTMATHLEIHQIKVLEVTGKGKFTR